MLKRIIPMLMQYRFPFPADYDMLLIRHRVEQNGHLLDNHAPLIFKAYLIQEHGQFGAGQSCYAPLYLWHNEAGMASFLQTDGFQALCQHFGRPSISHWPILLTRQQKESFRHSRFVTCTSSPLAISPPEKSPLASTNSLSELFAAEDRYAEQLMDDENITACFTALCPSAWQIHRFIFHQEPDLLPQHNDGQKQCWNQTTKPPLSEGDTFTLLHLSYPGLQECSKG